MGYEGRTCIDATSRFMWWICEEWKRFASLSLAILPQLHSKEEWAGTMWTALATACTLLLGQSLSQEQASLALSLLVDDFLPIWETRFGEAGATIVCHMICHLADDSVAQFGCPSALWLFPMERANGALTRFARREKKASLHLSLARRYHTYLSKFAADQCSGDDVVPFKLSKKREHVCLDSATLDSVEEYIAAYHPSILLPAGWREASYQLYSASRVNGVLYNYGTDVVVRSASDDEYAEEFVARVGYFFLCGTLPFFTVQTWYAYPSASQQTRHGAIEALRLHIMTATPAGSDFLVYSPLLLKRQLVMSKNPLWNCTDTRSHYYYKHDIFHALSIYNTSV